MARKSDVLTNPYHLALLGLAVLFALTSLAYLAVGLVPEASPRSEPGAWRRLALWLDRQAPRLLAFELIPMVPAAAMLVVHDRRTGRSKRRRRPRRQARIGTTSPSPAPPGDASMRAISNLVLAASLGLGLAGCGGSPEIGDAEIVPATPPATAEAAADAPAPDAAPADAPKPAPAETP